MKKALLTLLIIIYTAAFILERPCMASVTTRIKDITYVQGTRENQLYGYGLVIGLAGSGDTITFEFTQQVAVNLFEKLGVLITKDEFRSRNIAAVMVMANIPPFARPGEKIDVTVSSLGDAKSLEGGILLQTPLQGADNEIYAVAQGAISIGGYNVGAEGQSVRKNHANTATIPGGAIVEKEIPLSLFIDSAINLVLRDPDFTTAHRLANSINLKFPNIACAQDAAIVRIEPPEEFRTRNTVVHFISMLEELTVSPDNMARIIINERTGTIVAGENVRISTIAIAHGNLSITITERPEVSQPLPFSEGETVVVPRSDIEVEEEVAKLNIIPEGVTISEVARALNVLGVTPRDLISIFQAIKRSGALHAELIIM
jgi:flagellar P-ring protein precursor FlgI